MSNAVELRRYMVVVVRWWWLILGVTAGAAGVGYGVSRQLPPVYEAYTTLIVGQPIQAAALEKNDVDTSKQLVKLYADLAQRQPVLQATVEALKLSDSWQALRSRMRIELVNDTQLLEIKVQADSPEKAQATADEIAHQLILLSPQADAQDQESSGQERFVREQLTELQAKIEAGQTRIEELKTVMASLMAAQPAPAEQLSAAQVQEIQREINTLKQLIVDWQANYAQLLSLSRGTTNPFVREQLNYIQSEIETGQARIRELEEVIADSSLQTELPLAIPIVSPTEQVPELQNEINALETLIADWQNNYTQLLQSATVRNKSPNLLTLIEPAQIDPAETRPRTLLNTFLASGIGFVLALGGIFLREFLDNTIKSADEVSRILGLAYLGTGGHVKARQAPYPLVALQEPLSVASEAYRIIWSNIQLGSADQPIKSIMITSPTLTEGKSLTAANLGVAIAQAGCKAILVDVDPRRPMLHQIFDLPNQQGLTELLSSAEIEIECQLQDTALENLKVITSGVLPHTPSELFGSQRMKQLLVTLNALADIIILDGPPLLAVADATVLSAQVDGVVLVVEAEQTDRDKARQAILILRHVGAYVLGGVLNRVASTSAGY